MNLVAAAVPRCTARPPPAGPFLGGGRAWLCAEAVSSSWPPPESRAVRELPGPRVLSRGPLAASLNGFPRFLPSRPALQTGEKVLSMETTSNANSKTQPNS